MQRRWRALLPLLGVGALVGGALATSSPAGAQTEPAGTVTLVHAIVGTPVDVYADGNLVERPDATPPVTATAPFQPESFLSLGLVTGGHVEIQLFADDPAAPAPATAAARTDTALVSQHVPVP